MKKTLNIQIPITKNNVGKIPNIVALVLFRHNKTHYY